MTKRIEKLGADRLRVLKALVAGGCVEKRRPYPLPETFHLKRVDEKNTAPKVSELCMAELIEKGLIAPAMAVDLNTPGSADNIDFVITPAGQRAAQVKGIEYEDTQESLLDVKAGTYDTHPITSMEAA